MDNDLKKANDIMESWRFVNLDRCAVMLAGAAPNPGETVQKLRGARDDVAVLYNLFVGAAQRIARLEGELAELRQR